MAKDSKKEESQNTTKKDAMAKRMGHFGTSLIPLAIVFVFAWVYSGEPSSSSSASNSNSGGNQTTQPQPRPLPAPETVSVTTAKWSDPVPTHKYADAFVLTGLKPADVMVRVWSGNSYKDLPMGKTSGNVYDKVQFKSRGSKGKVQVHLFRTVEEKERWLREP